MSSHASLSAASDDRKLRLAKLKSLKRKQPSEAEDDQDGSGAPLDSNKNPESPPSSDVARMHLSGRNYDPETRGPKLGFEAPPTQALEQPTLEELAADLEEESKRKAALDAQDDKGIDLFKLQPKKPNWDLKRELNQKLEVLNVRTDNAIAKMVRERLAAKKAAATTTTAQSDGNAQQGEESGMLDGAALVEGMRQREKEEAEEERRERELEELEMAPTGA